MKKLVIGSIVASLFTLVAPRTADAQFPVAVRSYYPGTPVVTYLPERRGLFGQRIVYRPHVTYAPIAAPVVTAPPVAPATAAPTTTFYAPAPTTSFYAPAPAPVTTYYAPAPVTTFYAPVPATSYYVWP